MMENNIEVLIPEEKLQERISELSEQINKDFAGKAITLICILKGGVMFMVDLAKKLSLNLELDFMDISSYGDSTESSGKLKVLKDLENSIEGKDVLLVEDIIDTGRTLSYLVEYLKSKNPNSFKICALLDKPDRRIIDVDVDYIGFKIPDKFVIGYGLDYNQYYRNLPYIGVYNPKKEN